MIMNGDLRVIDKYDSNVLYELNYLIRMPVNVKGVPPDEECRTRFQSEDGPMKGIEILLTDRSMEFLRGYSGAP